MLFRSKDGMAFTQAYAGAPVCAPSRCTLMTVGTYVVPQLVFVIVEVKDCGCGSSRDVKCEKQLGQKLYIQKNK